MANKTKKNKKVTIRQAAYAALWDTIQVAIYSGVPATGVIVFINTLAYDVPTIARYAPYIASGFNVASFGLKRFFEYYMKKRDLPDFIN